ncbi:subtype B tannase [Streptomyces gossypiisoli]|uniref:subtype B tannase n=1 Tax=Streptomyces gossypiisoli TaxID=2748864 RepID=UPI0015DA7405|nr:subtype B tannase [Streptomyces gossypiisoli]
MGLGVTAGAATVGGVALTAQASQGTAASKSAKASNSLVFDKDAYTELTTTITAVDGSEKEVTYHFWKAITYVADPVDVEHQSLVVSVPVKIDGKAVDATDAPILFTNSVGGYMPANVSSATGVGEAVMEMGNVGAPSGSSSPSASGGTGPGGGGGTGGGPGGGVPNLAKIALAAGYVVVEPGARGRSLVDANGVYYGTAPAVIVDLKAAIRYLRANKGRIPGNTDRIISAGGSAGGALSALLGASGDSPLYAKYLKELGAADASDAVFASAEWCPITDLEHADGAYEYCWGTSVTQKTGSQVDQTVSKDLTAQFATYQASLKLKGINGFGRLTAGNYDEYLVETYLQPAATTYLKSLSDSDRSAYLAKNTFITWDSDRATFTWAGFVDHVGTRKKSTPAFDAFDLSAGENNLFGTGTTAARHFTLYSLRHEVSGSARLDSDIPELLNLMNPMYFIRKRNPGRSKHWWIRVGTKDTDSSPVIVGNLAAALDGIGDNVNSLMYWDAGHGANDDPVDFLEWIADVSGHKK